VGTLGAPRPSRGLLWSQEPIYSRDLIAATWIAVLRLLEGTPPVCMLTGMFDPRWGSKLRCAASLARAIVEPGADLQQRFDRRDLDRGLKASGGALHHYVC